MLAQGVNYDELLAGASLPGGYYTWEVVAYLPDGRQVSNTGRASMSVFKAQPPQITFPAHQATVAAAGIGTVPFQWISRSTSPASVLGTIYDLKIYELPDEVTDPNVSVLSGLLPVFNTQTASTSYFYGPGDPLLQPGKRYAIVVQAQDIGGGDSYENQGLSQVVAFKVAGQADAAAQAACPAPTGLSIRQDDGQTLEVSWNPVAEANDYLLQFRKANEPWQSQTTTDNGLMLIQLSPAKYEVQVATRCNAGLVSTISPIVNYEIGIAPKDSTEDEIEDILSYYNEDEETPEPEEYEEPEEEDGLDILNTPFTLLIDTDALPDSLKANLPPGGSLPILPENPTIEQLKDAVKAKKTTCAAVIAGYTCGNHDAASPPSGDDYQPQPGDELAMNSIKIEVVEIDAAGNGLGIAHIKGFNNAKLGVEFKGIKVKEGGCIYAGQAITNSVDLALLNEKQRAALAKAYAIFNKVLDKIEANADGVAETINGFLDGLQKAKQKAQALNAKIAAGQTPTEAEVKTLAKLEDQNLKTMTAAIDQLKKKYKDDINTEALALMEGYMADKRAAATALASYKPSMGPPPAAILQATANSQPELIEKTMKSVGALEVEYNGKTYAKGKTIKINPESLDGIIQGNSDIPLNCGFFLKNMVDGEPITWKLQTQAGAELPLEPPLRISASATDAYMGIKWPDGHAKLKLTATSGGRSVSLNLEKPDWFVKDLVATDGSRKAKDGETLYLVKAPAKDERATISWSSNLDPMLLKNHYFVNGNTITGNLTSNKIPYTFSNSPSTTTYRLNALGYDKSVKVEVVDENKKFEEDASTFKFWDVAQKLKNAISYADQFVPGLKVYQDENAYKTETGLAFYFKPKIVGVSANKEATSRLYYRETTHSYVAELGVKGNVDVPIPGLAIPKVNTWLFGYNIKVEAGLYVGIEAALKGEVGLSWLKKDYIEGTRYDSEVIKPYPVRAVAEGKLTFGPKGVVAVLDDGKAIISGKFKGQASATGEIIEVSYRYDRNDFVARSPLIENGVRLRFDINAEVQIKSFPKWEKLLYRVEYYWKP